MPKRRGSDSLAIPTRDNPGLSWHHGVNRRGGVSPLDRSQDWWDEALGDLAHAESDLERGFYNWACFSAQQAAEKAVKAVCQRLGGEAWGHSVHALLDALAARISIPADVRDRALELDKAYIPTRYPDAHPAGAPRRLYTASEARRMLDHARAILDFCARHLSTP